MNGFNDFMRLDVSTIRQIKQVFFFLRKNLELWKMFMIFAVEKEYKFERKYFIFILDGLELWKASRFFRIWNFVRLYLLGVDCFSSSSVEFIFLFYMMNEY